MKEIEALRMRLKDLDELNLSQLMLKSFASVPQREYGFFPGGNGLHSGEHAQTFPRHGMLILGSNFGAANLLDERNEWIGQDARDGQTWRPLLKLLAGARLEKKQCFFTNAWPFLHFGEGKLNRLMGT